MKFNSQICTTEEQSKRLLALGLKKETADMAYNELKEMAHTLPYTEVVLAIERSGGSIWSQVYSPAWSLHRLLCLLPTEYIADIDFQQVMQDFVFRSQDMYDEVISCIETLIKEGYFYKEYLE